VSGVRSAHRSLPGPRDRLRIAAVKCRAPARIVHGSVDQVLCPECGHPFGFAPTVALYDDVLALAFLGPFASITDVGLPDTEDGREREVISLNSLDALRELTRSRLAPAAETIRQAAQAGDGGDDWIRANWRRLTAVAYAVAYVEEHAPGAIMPVGLDQTLLQARLPEIQAEGWLQLAIAPRSPSTRSTPSPQTTKEP
jgi:hypothetical protein